MAQMVYDPKRYWETRKDLPYYRESLRFCQKYGRGASSVLEVGPRDTTFLEGLDWIPRKVAIDLLYKPVIAGCENIQGDFITWTPGEMFDLGVCMQVMEHLENPAPFAAKLLASARSLVVSVPYMWPAGQCKNHLQDPVNLDKVSSWFGRRPLEHRIVTDRDSDRLVVAY